MCFCKLELSRQNGNLQRHIGIHTGDQPYKCDVCGKGFSVNCYLQKHMRRYTGDTPYKCDNISHL
jgi:KRAB domain-containing zinc finger protein